MIDTIIEKIWMNIPKIHLFLCIYVVISPFLISYGLQKEMNIFVGFVFLSMAISLIFILMIGLLCDSLKTFVGEQERK